VRLVVVRGEQPLDLGSQRRIIGARRRQVGTAVSGRQVECRVEHRLDGAPALGRHRGRDGHAPASGGRMLRRTRQRPPATGDASTAWPASSACSQARAFTQSRRTVRSVTPRMAGDLLLRQPAEEAQLHHPREPLGEGGQPPERLVERDELLGALLDRHLHVVERERGDAAAALARAVPARVLDEHLPHGPRGDGEEVPAVAHVEAPGVGQLEVGLVHERRGGERVPARAHASLAAELRAGDRAQVLVHERVDALQGVRVARVMRLQQGRHRPRLHLGVADDRAQHVAAGRRRLRPGHSRGTHGALTGHSRGTHGARPAPRRAPPARRDRPVRRVRTRTRR
jgi:hypothetical protein